jgi:non-heme chloroperoxidase
MDTYAADVVALTDHLDLHNAVHVSHSTGGGEVVKYVARAKRGRVAKAVLAGAVCPIMLRTDANPGGLPVEIFDGLRAALVANRAQFFIDLPAGPFYGFNRPGATISEGVIRNWWRQGMTGSAKAHYDCIKAFSETDFSEDLKSIDVPTLVMHGDDDQIVPYADAGPLSAKLLRKGTLNTYAGLLHGMCTTHSDIIKLDMLGFVKG